MHQDYLNLNIMTELTMIIKANLKIADEAGEEK